MTKRFLLGVALAATCWSPLCAQVAPATAPDPARLVLATKIIEQVLPASQRDAMVDQMVRPMMANIAEAMQSAPQLAEIRSSSPGFEATMQLFIADEQERALANLKRAMPMFSKAMAKAYARRFDEKQLNELSAFFATPTGRVYIQQSMTIMSDPDIAAAQREMMMRSMDGMQERIAAVIGEMAADSTGRVSE